MQHGGARLNAGRPKGSKNKRTLEILDMLGDFHPVTELASMAQDKTLSVELRLECLKLLLPYCAAKISPMAPMAFESRHNKQDTFGLDI